MEHIDSKKDRIITHKSFDPLFFHFSPNKTLWQNYTFKGTTSSRTIATWLPFVSHPLFRIFSWQRLFHYFATWIEANPSSSEASQRFWGSYSIFGFSKLMLNFTSFPLNYFQLTWIHHIVHKKNPGLMGRCQETRNPPNCTSYNYFSAYNHILKKSADFTPEISGVYTDPWSTVN